MPDGKVVKLDGLKTHNVRYWDTARVLFCCVALITETQSRHRQLLGGKLGPD